MKKKEKAISLRMDEELYAKIKKEAEERHYSVSQYIRVILLEYFSHQGMNETGAGGGFYITST